MKINGESIYYGNQTASDHLVQNIQKNWRVSVSGKEIQADDSFYEILEVSSLTSIQGTVTITAYERNGNSLSGFEPITKTFNLQSSIKSATILDNTPLQGASLYIKYSIVDNKLILSMSVTKSIINTTIKMTGTVSIQNLSYVGGALPRLDLTANSNIFNEKVVVNELQVRDKMVLKYKHMIGGQSDSYICPVTGLYVIKPFASDTISIIYKTSGSSYTNSNQCYIWLLTELEM